jgi:adenosylmethionine-8-amino-7-oxononanoate aminotransferase
LFREEDTLGRVARLEAQLRAGLPQFRGMHGVGDVRGIGGVGVVELSGDGYFDAMGPRMSAAFLERGLLLRPLGNVLYFLPPYCISESQTEWCLTQISEVLREMEREG